MKTFNAQRSTSELNVGRWTLDVGRFAFSLELCDA